MYFTIEHLLETRQWVFRKNIRTVEALHNVVEFIVYSKKRKIYRFLLTLENRSSFNKVPRADIFQCQEERGVETLPSRMTTLVPFDQTE